MNRNYSNFTTENLTFRSFKRLIKFVFWNAAPGVKTPPLEKNVIEFHRNEWIFSKIFIITFQAIDFCLREPLNWQKQDMPQFQRSPGQDRQFDKRSNDLVVQCAELLYQPAYRSNRERKTNIENWFLSTEKQCNETWEKKQF